MYGGALMVQHHGHIHISAKPIFKIRLFDQMLIEGKWLTEGQLRPGTFIVKLIMGVINSVMKQACVVINVSHFSIMGKQSNGLYYKCF